MPVPQAFADQFSDPRTDGYDAAKHLGARITCDEADGLREMMADDPDESQTWLGVETSLFLSCKAAWHGRGERCRGLRQLIESLDVLIDVPGSDPDYTNFMLGFIDRAEEKDLSRFVDGLLT